MNAALLAGVAALISALVGAAAYVSGNRQNGRTQGLQADTIRSEANDELIHNLRQDNSDLRQQLVDIRAEHVALRSELELSRRDCRQCNERLDRLASEVYGRHGPEIVNPKETPSP